MKKNYFLAFCSLACLPAVAQFEMKSIQASLSQINEHLYASKYEVSNKLYGDFLRALQASNDLKALVDAQIDTLNWLEPTSKNEPYVHYFHRHPAYQNYPVFNVSYEGAKRYCEWLTENYNQNSKRKFKKVIFKLPSEQEWILAAKGGNVEASYPWKGEALYTTNNLAKCNFLNDITDSSWQRDSVASKMDVMAPVKFYPPNDYGLYNISGNAAEMTSTKGLTKGGSWRTTSDYLKIDAVYHYDGSAQQFVGFRYFMEVIEN